MYVLSFIIVHVVPSTKNCNEDYCKFYQYLHLIFIMFKEVLFRRPGYNAKLQRLHSLSLIVMIPFQNVLRCLSQLSTEKTGKSLKVSHLSHMCTSARYCSVMIDRAIEECAYLDTFGFSSRFLVLTKASVREMLTFMCNWS